MRHEFDKAARLSPEQLRVANIWRLGAF